MCHEADLFVFEKCQAEANSFVFGRRNAQFVTRQICLCLGIARPRESRGGSIYVWEALGPGRQEADLFCIQEVLGPERHGADLCVYGKCQVQ